MALSEAEQELLARLEASLAAEDPKLAQKLAHPPERRLHPRRATLAVIGTLIGLALLVIGLSTYIWLSVVGFIAMLVSAIGFFTAWQAPTVGSAPVQATSAKAQADFMSRLERRWKDRQSPEA